MERPPETFKCCIISWDEIYTLAKILALKVRNSGFKPDLIIGIARGGLVPARIVCDLLLIKDLATIKVEHWGTATPLGKATIKYPLPVDISGKKILIVDDIADTGETFAVLMDYIKEKNAKEARYSVLHYKACSNFIPDYWAEKQEEWQWIIYPWAVYEDLIDFTKRVLVKPMTIEEIRKALKEKFDLNISKNDIAEMLESMYAAAGIRKSENDALKTRWVL